VQQDSVWLELRELGLTPGMSLFLNEVNVTKQQGLGRSGRSKIGV
jgi:hypothetical protein